MSSEAMQKALAAAKAEAGKSGKAKDKTGKAVQTAADAPVTPDPVEKVVADATPALKDQTEEIVAGAEALNEVLKPAEEVTTPVAPEVVEAAGPEPTLHEQIEELVSRDPLFVESLPAGVPAFDDVDTAGNLFKIVDGEHVPVGQIAPTFDPGDDVELYEEPDEIERPIFVDTIRLQHPTEGTPKPRVFANFDRLPPVRGSHPTFKG